MKIFSIFLKTQLVHRPSTQKKKKKKLVHRPPPPPTLQNSTSEEKTTTNHQTTIVHSNDSHCQPKIQIGKTSQKATTINQEKPLRTQIENPRNKEHNLKI